jgi:hypothetical protein
MLAAVNLLFYAIILPILAKGLQMWLSMSSSKVDWVLAFGSCIPLFIGTAIIGLSSGISGIIIGMYQSPIEI